MGWVVPMRTARSQPVANEELRALRAGEPAALERALQALLPGVRAELYRLVGGGEELQDVTQEALIAIAAALPRYDGRASLAYYAKRITVRTAYRHFRKRPRHRTVPLLDTLPASSGCPESETARERLRQRLQAHLRALPPQQRMAFALCELEGMSGAEAADLMGVAPGTLRSHVHRARAQLERVLRTDPALRGWFEGGDAGGTDV